MVFPLTRSNATASLIISAAAITARSSSHAQNSGSPDRSVQANPQSDAESADALFRLGRDLMKQKKFAAACEKLGQSHRREPSGSTNLHLALCNKEIGKTGTAWSQIAEARRFAERDRRSDRERAARTHVQELHGKVPTITIVVNTATT